MPSDLTRLIDHEVACVCPCCAVDTLSNDGVSGGSGTGGTRPVFSDTQVIDQLTTNWNSSGLSIAWDEDVVTYTVSNLSAADGGREEAGWMEMSAVMQDVAREAFALWDDLIAIDLVEAAGDARADMSFNYSSTTGGSTYAAPSGYYGGGRAEAYFTDVDMWFADNWWTHNEDSDLYNGGYGVMTYLHEIGHALGLSHPGQYNGSADFADDAAYYQDTRQYTTMSYFNAGQSGEEVDHIGANGYYTRYASTPLLHDILALQSLYGADMETRTDNTTYGFNSTAGRDAFDFSLTTDPIIAIWDAGGIDTIDVSGYDTDQHIDLTAGAFSSIGAMTSNLAIAHGAVIERAIGGSGNDRIDGNDARNILSGGAGDDALSGGDGHDTLRGGDGADALTGGEGSDRAVYNRSTEGVTVNLDIGEGSGGTAEGDTFDGIERITGSRHDDTLIGDAERNVLIGDRGDDVLDGGAGNDMMRGGAGADTLTGGDGMDWAAYFRSDAGVTIDLGAGTASGGSAEGDVLTGIERLRGSDHDDTLTGDDGRNILRGDDGDDILAGGGGRDVLRGDDGADQFIFDDATGFDTVADFENGTDLLVIDAGAGLSFDDLVISSHRGDAMITFADSTIHLRGVDLSLVTEDDFVFV